jgi:predicted nucleic acid-binding protein
VELTLAIYLIDKSAFARIHIGAIRAHLDPLILDGKIATTGVAMIEVLYSARGVADYRLQRKLLNAMPRVGLSEAIVERALIVQQSMAERGTQRSASVADLLLAAVAEANDLTLLHYDADFDLIADVTGQPSEWVVPAGSI